LKFDNSLFLTREVERDLLVRAKAGDRAARDRLVLAHRPQVIGAARKFARVYPTIDIDDLISEGNIGLMAAIRSFDMEQTVRFATYAVYHIGNRVRDFILRNAAHGVSFAGTTATRALFFKSRMLLMNESASGRPLAEQYQRVANKLGVTVRQLTDFLNFGTSSLDAPPPGGTGEAALSSVGELLVDATAPDPEEHTDESQRAKLLHDALNRLEPRDRLVLISRFMNNETLEGAAATLKVTRERVRQIESRALRRLKDLLIDLQPEPERTAAE